MPTIKEIRLFYWVQMPRQWFVFIKQAMRPSRRGRAAVRVMTKSKASYSSSSLLTVISLIWPAGEHALKSESCLSTLAAGVDHSTGTLSMNIHQFHNMPVSNIPPLSHAYVNIKTPRALGGHGSPSLWLNEMCFYYLFHELLIFMAESWTLGLFLSGFCQRIKNHSFKISHVAHYNLKE